MFNGRVTTKIPPFFGGPVSGHKKIDWLSKDGALKLAATIEKAWADVGRKVRCDVYQAHGKRGSDFAIRSSLINGVPPR